MTVTVLKGIQVKSTICENLLHNHTLITVANQSSATNTFE